MHGTQNKSIFLVEESADLIECRNFLGNNEIISREIVDYLVTNIEKMKDSKGETFYF